MPKKIFILLFVLLLLTGCGRVESTQTLLPTEPTQSDTESKEDTVVMEEETDPIAVICLDAGHGFADPGCESEYLNGYESEVTLAITLLLKEKLEQEGAKVILTHDGVTYPTAAQINEYAIGAGIDFSSQKLIENDIFSAYERGVYIAVLQQRMDVDFALSLHINSAEDYPNTSRYELYYYEDNPYALRLNAFCEGVAADADNETRILPTSYDDSYYVTKFTSKAALLLEMGYATNREDAEKLNDPAWREAFTELLAKNILMQFGENKISLG